MTFTATYRRGRTEGQSWDFLAHSGLSNLNTFARSLLPLETIRWRLAHSSFRAIDLENVTFRWNIAHRKNNQIIETKRQDSEERIVSQAHENKSRKPHTQTCDDASQVSSHFHWWCDVALFSPSHPIPSQDSFIRWSRSINLNSSRHMWTDDDDSVRRFSPCLWLY